MQLIPYFSATQVLWKVRRVDGYGAPERSTSLTNRDGAEHLAQNTLELTHPGFLGPTGDGIGQRLIGELDGLQ